MTLRCTNLYSTKDVDMDDEAQSWRDMKKSWHHTYHESRIQSQEHIVLPTHALMNPNTNRAKKTQIMSKTYVDINILVVLSLLSLCTTGRIMLDAGDDNRIVPIYEGLYSHNIT